MMEIWTNGDLAATSALVSIIWSILAASCVKDAAKTSRAIPLHTMAPMHMAHGSPDVRPVLDDDGPERKVGLACLVERDTHETLVLSLRWVTWAATKVACAAVQAAPARNERRLGTI